jgi:hypothetical protein
VRLPAVVPAVADVPRRGAASIVVPLTRGETAGRATDRPSREHAGAVAALAASRPPAVMAAKIPLMAGPGPLSPLLLLVGALALLVLAAAVERRRRR